MAIIFVMQAFFRREAGHRVIFLTDNERAAPR